MSLPTGVHNFNKPAVETNSYREKVPFNFQCFICEHSLTASDTLTPVTTTSAHNEYQKPVPGARAIYRLIADGTHTPTFSGFKQLSPSNDYVKTQGAVNIVMFLYDGVDHWYSIFQDAATI